MVNDTHMRRRRRRRETTTFISFSAFIVKLSGVIIGGCGLGSSSVVILYRFIWFILSLVYTSKERLWVLFYCNIADFIREHSGYGAGVVKYKVLFVGCCVQFRSVLIDESTQATEPES